MRNHRDITNPDVAKALAHPLRVEILGVLEERTASPRELSELLGAELTLVSYHVRRLAAAKLIKLVARKQRRGAIEHYYEAAPKTTITSEAWGQVPSVAKASMVDATVAKVGQHVAAAAAAGGFDRGDAHLTRTPVVLDARGWSQLAKRLDRLMEDLDQISAQCEQRLKGKPAEERLDAQVVLMLFEGAPEAAVAAQAAHEPHPARKPRRAPARRA
jgi:DNA-binding transcriptional ArsR family regulator